MSRKPEYLRIAQAAYGSHFDEYQSNTEAFSYFPGLREELDRFRSAIRRTGPILDLGCGPGRDSIYMASLGATVVAADATMEMLTSSLFRRTGSKGRPAVVQLDMASLPFRADTFAGAWVCASMLHLPRLIIPTALSELYRVLKPGGQVAISMKSGTGEGLHNGETIKEARWFTLFEPHDFVELVRNESFAHICLAHSGRRDWFIVEATKPGYLEPAHRAG